MDCIFMRPRTFIQKLFSHEGDMNYLITRHPGALEWLNQVLIEPAIHLHHLQNLDGIGSGDTVIGTLPVNLIAQVCRKGARYLHLEIDVPQQLRGQELTVRQMVQLGIVLVEYHAHRPVPDEEVLRLAAAREVQE